MILTLKTSTPVCELELFKAEKSIAKLNWQADRKLAKELLSQLEEFLQNNNLVFGDLSGLVAFSGPGSFTGLRIGATVANTLAYSLDIPIVGANGQNWQSEGLKRLKADENDKIVRLDYGQEPHITKAKK
jgi:tRNA threonylcarbamoyladenosine biosynthesis protein TsaB